MEKKPVYGIWIKPVRKNNSKVYYSEIGVFEKGHSNWLFATNHKLQKVLEENLDINRTKMMGIQFRVFHTKKEIQLMDFFPFALDGIPNIDPRRIRLDALLKRTGTGSLIFHLVLRKLQKEFPEHKISLLQPSTNMKNMLKRIGIKNTVSARRYSSPRDLKETSQLVSDYVATGMKRNKIQAKEPGQMFDWVPTQTPKSERGKRIARRRA